MAMVAFLIILFALAVLQMVEAMPTRLIITPPPDLSKRQETSTVENLISYINLSGYC